MKSREIERIAAAIDAAVAGMTVEQLAWRPEAGQWSAAQVLEHLSLTYGGTARLLRKLAANGGSSASRPTTSQRFAAFVVTRLGYFPPGRTAPEVVRPAGAAPELALQQVRETLAAMDAGLAAAQEKFRPGQKADHPVLGPLTLRQWRRFHWVHTRHHMRQIARLRRLQAG